MNSQDSSLTVGDIENGPGSSATPNDGGIQAKAKESAKAAGSAIKDEASSLGAKAAESARTAADSGKAKAAGALGHVSKIITDSAGQIDAKFGPSYGDYARKAASAIDGLAGQLDAKAVDDLVEDARGFVKRNPAIAIGAAAALGFVLTRVVKAGLDDA